MTENDQSSTVTYRCTDCGYENQIEGFPIKLRTCPECGGQYVGTDTDGGREP